MKLLKILMVLLLSFAGFSQLMAQDSGNNSVAARDAGVEACDDGWSCRYVPSDLMIVTYNGETKRKIMKRVKKAIEKDPEDKEKILNDLLSDPYVNNDVKFKKVIRKTFIGS